LTCGTLSLIDTVGVRTFVAACDRSAGKYGERFPPTAELRQMAAKNTRFYA
jgi:3-hydroxyacyl-CoA dehydrogenase/enoyl-CoA hydratase/3-hydroxybutyryl-CoA epimerase